LSNPKYENKLRFKESTGIYQAYNEDSKWCRALGWWAVDGDKPSWAMFKFDHDARLWKKLVYETPVV
jgi:hypothetical protein